MSDSFSNISNSNIINRSILQNSYNKVKEKHGEETVKALEEITKFIDKSGSPVATAGFNEFNKELTQPQPDKSKLKKIWEEIEKVLPTISTIATSVTKILPLFA